MSLIKKFAGQAVIYGVGSILSRVVYFLLVSLLLANLLGEKTLDFGTFAFFYAYASVFITLFSFRFDTALFRYGNKKEQLDKAFNTALVPVIGSALILVVIGLTCSQLIADWIDYPDDSRYVMWFAFILAFDVINLIPFAKLRLTDRAKEFAIYKIFNVTLSSILILIFLVLVPKYRDSLFSFMPILPSLIDWVFIANLIASGLLFLGLLPVWKGFKFQVDGALLRKMTYYVLPLVIVGVANGIIQFFAVPLQKEFLGGTHDSNMSASGVYDFTRRIASLFVMFTTAFNYAAEPFFFNNSTLEDRNLLYGKICRLFTLVGGLVIVGLFLSQDLLKYIVVSDYWEAISLLPVLLVAYLLLGLYYNVSIWYKLSDRTWYGALFSIIGVIITLVVSILFLPRIGYAASAWATLISYSVMVVMAYLIGKKIYPIPYPTLKIGRDLLVISVILLVGHFLRGQVSITVRYICYILMMIVFVIYVWKSEEQEWKKILSRST